MVNSRKIKRQFCLEYVNRNHTKKNSMGAGITKVFDFQAPTLS